MAALEERTGLFTYWFVYIQSLPFSCVFLLAGLCGRLVLETNQGHLLMDDKGSSCHLLVPASASEAQRGRV